MRPVSPPEWKGWWIIETKPGRTVEETDAHGNKSRYTIGAEHLRDKGGTLYKFASEDEALARIAELETPAPAAKRSRKRNA